MKRRSSSLKTLLNEDNIFDGELRRVIQKRQKTRGKTTKTTLVPPPKTMEEDLNVIQKCWDECCKWENILGEKKYCGLNAVKTSTNIGLKLITFSGFESNNPLKKCGDINFWVDSNSYNIPT